MFASIWRKGWRRRLTLAALLTVATVVPWLIALTWPTTVTTFFRPLSKFLSRCLATLFSIVPFSIFEWALLVLAIDALVQLIRLIVRVCRQDNKRQLLADAVGALVLWIVHVIFAFTWLWGLNYAAPTLSQTLQLPVEPRDAAFLKLVTADLAEKANATAQLVARNDDKVALYRNVRTSGVHALAAYQTLAEADKQFANAGPNVKRITGSLAFSWMGTSGIYFPFTGECNVNPDSPAAPLPFTVCHELAHRLGFAREEEANYVAFMTCRVSDDPLTKYSGYIEALTYCYNQLSENDRADIAALLCDEVLADWYAIYDHYHQYEGVIQEISEAVNDSYLKVIGQDEGIQSYGMVVDLILADYAKNDCFGGTP